MRDDVPVRDLAGGGPFDEGGVALLDRLSGNVTIPTHGSSAKRREKGGDLPTAAVRFDDREATAAAWRGHDAALLSPEVCSSSDKALT